MAWSARCTYRETAIVTARLFQQYNPGAKVLITDLRDFAVAAQH